MFDEIRMIQEYSHPIEKVWNLLTDSNQLARWLMPNDFAPVVGREFTMTTAPKPGFDGLLHCKVLELDRPRRMRWSWKAGSMESAVVFELTSTMSGTRLELRHAGFRGLADMVPWFLIRHGWKKKLRVAIMRMLVTSMTLPP